MNGDGADGIVDAQPLEKFDTHDDQHAGNSA